MAGLLDFLNTDQGRMGLGLLAAAGPRTDGAGFGQRLQEGMGSFDAYKKQKRADQMQEMEMQAYMQKAEQQKALRELQKQFTTPAQSAIAGIPDRAAGNAMGNPNLFSNSSSNAVVPGVEGRAARPASLDREGFGQAWEAMDPMAGGAYLSSIQKDNKPIALAEGSSLVRPDGSTIFKGAPKAEAQPSAVKEYQFAVGQGYKGSFDQWSTSQKRAGATNVSLSNVGPKAFEGELGKLDAEQLGKWRDGAMTAQSTISTAQRLDDAAANGAYSGGAANLKMTVGSYINGLTGATPKGQIGSELYTAEANNLILSQIKALGTNPSNADLAFIQKTVPQLSTNAEARKQMTQFMREKAQASIGLYKRADEHARKNSGLGGFNVIEPAGSIDDLVNKYK